MNLRDFSKLLLITGIMLGCSITASASTVTLYFGPPDFVWFHQGSSATPNHIWLAGDYWAQDFTGTGLSSADAMTLNLNYNDNTLIGPALDLNAMVDGTIVGSFSVGDGVKGMHSYSFAFAPISGPNYDIEIIATNSIPTGQGSVSISADNATSNVVLSGGVPEPGTLSLLGMGIAAIVAARFRRKRA